jgi:hypothetical protein
MLAGAAFDVKIAGVHVNNGHRGGNVHSLRQGLGASERSADRSHGPCMIAVGVHSVGT